MDCWMLEVYLQLPLLNAESISAVVTAECWKYICSGHCWMLEVYLQCTLLNAGSISAVVTAERWKYVCSVLFQTTEWSVKWLATFLYAFKMNSLYIAPREIYRCAFDFYFTFITLFKFYLFNHTQEYFSIVEGCIFCELHLKTTNGNEK